MALSRRRRLALGLVLSALTALWGAVAWALIPAGAVATGRGWLWAMLAGSWAVAIMSPVSLLQRVWFAWKRYRFVDPAALQLAQDDDGRAKSAG